MYKQVLVVRRGLRMSRGKLAVQCSHASYSAAANASAAARRAWERDGQKKIALEAELDALHALQRRCDALKLPCALIADAGETELEPGTVTCLGIGPADEKRIDTLTGSLPLLK